MKYDQSVHGLSIQKDVFGEHFSSDVKTSYMVFHEGDCIDEDENSQALAKRIDAKAKRLQKIANFLKKIKVKQ